MATILQLFKDRIHLDVTAIDLVEITNGNIDTQNIPLFVFETQEAGQTQQLPEGYAWEEPNIFRKIIEDYEIEGVPFFYHLNISEKTEDRYDGLFLLKTFCK